KRRSGLSSIGNRWKIAESAVSERQRIVSFSAFQADSASPRFVSAQSASRDPPVTLPPLHLASGGELLAGDAKPPVRRRTDSGRCRNDRVAQVLAVDVTCAPSTTTLTSVRVSHRSRFVIVRLLLKQDRGQDVHDIGRHEKGGTSPRRVDRAPRRCRAGGGLLGGKDPAGRFLASSPLVAVAALTAA